MKRTAITFALATAFFSAIAQTISSQNLLIRRDTIVLNASECNWVINSLHSNGQKSRSIPILILQAVNQGKLRAIDPVTGDPIPAERILQWHMPADTVTVQDAAGNSKYAVVQSEQNPDLFTMIRICQDCYFERESGKIRGEIRFIELLKDIYTPTGTLIGHSTFCRIYN